MRVWNQNQPQAEGCVRMPRGEGLGLEAKGRGLRRERMVWNGH